MNVSRRESIKALAVIGIGSVARTNASAKPSQEPAASQRIDRLPDAGRRQPAEWAARWIASPDAADQPIGVYHYRCAFAVGAVPTALPVRVSADQRFKLYLNGQLVGAGPALGDSQHWRYERLDLAPNLKPGRNVLAAVVWYGDGPTAALCQAGFRPGFLLSLEEPVPGLVLDTGHAPWRVLRNQGHRFLPIRREDMMGYFALGPTDRIEASLYPWNWAAPEFDDSAWQQPESAQAGRPRGFNAPGGDGGHYLEASPLPAQELKVEPVGRIVKTEGWGEQTLPPGALADSAITIPAGATVRLLLDHGVMTTAYVSLSTQSGAGATVRLRYAEALLAGDMKLWQKGNRNEIAGKVLHGYADTFVLDGAARTFEPLYWRAFRYLQIEVEAGASPVELTRLTTVFSGAPLEPSARFSASDPQLGTIWSVGVRTLRCNAHETYSDCPHFEQLQYIGDTRLSALTTFAIVGPRARPLVRNALELFDVSRLPEGITQSRYPSREMQLIPPFSLWYVMMVGDFWLHSDDPEDPEFLRRLLPGIRGVLAWFEERTNARGLLGPLPWWNFVDWNFTDGGSPPGAVDPELGGSSIISLQYVLALQSAAQLEDGLGDPAIARSNRATAQRVGADVLRLTWDASRNLLADTPLGLGRPATFSQHPTALAILAGLLSPDQQAAASRALLASLAAGPTSDVSPATLYFRYYLHRALVAAGHGEAYLDWLGPWRQELASGLTTWPETPGRTRSDCHAWSAHPTRELMTTVLGVESSAPGFRRVTITPRLGRLEWAEGDLPHPRGSIRVKLRRSGGGVEAEIALPPGVSGTLVSGRKRQPISGSFKGVLAG